ncbi:hypothetical protein ZOSMA_104G00020 [Zostera marina]|uniref:Uncharacterized protein n=1 Tax=Zostera marina TaxID=29655 RepID=A0A0K9Q4Q0_ZOSMR|nr:hypothetical protein ZOSMA_104G00020 [Zostera marina]
MVANDFKLLPMDVPWIKQDQKNIDKAMATIQRVNLWLSTCQ